MRPPPREEGRIIIFGRLLLKETRYKTNKINPLQPSMAVHTLSRACGDDIIYIDNLYSFQCIEDNHVIKLKRENKYNGAKKFLKMFPVRTDRWRSAETRLCLMILYSSLIFFYREAIFCASPITIENIGAAAPLSWWGHVPFQISESVGTRGHTTNVHGHSLKKSAYDREF